MNRRAFLARSAALAAAAKEILAAYRA